MAKGLIDGQRPGDQRNSDEVWLSKSRLRQGLIRTLAKGRDQENKALIPNETNKVRSHKNYPKYLAYNKVIHIGL